jgi:hypothetical protein
MQHSRYPTENLHLLISNFEFQRHETEGVSFVLRCGNKEKLTSPSSIVVWFVT